MARCEATTLSGDRCRKQAGANPLCHIYDGTGRKGGPSLKVTQDQVAQALEKSGGLKAVAARLLDVEWQTVHRAVRRWPELQELIDQSRETILDEAELSLRKLVRDGSLGAICFTLKCLGKKRGWVERQEITGAGGGPVEVEHSPIPLESLSLDTKRRIVADLEASREVIDVTPELKRIGKSK